MSISTLRRDEITTALSTLKSTLLAGADGPTPQTHINAVMDTGMAIFVALKTLHFLITQRYHGPLAGITWTDANLGIKNTQRETCEGAQNDVMHSSATYRLRYQVGCGTAAGDDCVFDDDDEEEEEEEEEEVVVAVDSDGMVLDATGFRLALEVYWMCVLRYDDLDFEEDVAVDIAPMSFL